MARRERREYQIRSVCQAFTLLEQFLGATDDLNVVELAQMLQSSNKHILRLLQTLAAHNYVEKNHHTGNYNLGLTTFTLSRTCIENRQLVKEGRPVLERLSAITGETVYILVWRNSSIFYADVVESTLPVRVVVKPGTLPLYLTAAGKLLMAHVVAPSTYLDANGLGRKDERTNEFAMLLAGQLEEIRKKGYAVDLGEYEPGVFSVAAPVRDHSSRVIATVSIAVPSFRLEPENVDGELALLVMQAGRQISLKMGYKEPVCQELTEKNESCFSKKGASSYLTEPVRPERQKKSTVRTRSAECSQVSEVASLATVKQFCAI